MSSAALDLVRSINEAHERGDFSSADWADPAIEYVIADGPEPGRWKGSTPMAEIFRGVLVGWKDLRIEVDECRQLDDERVLVLMRSTAFGKANGMLVGKMRAKGAVLYQVRNGRVIRLVYYWDREHALAAVGLPPEEQTPAA